MENLNINRIGHLLRYRFALHIKNWVLQALGILGIAIIISGILFLDQETINEVHDAYGFFYFITMLLTGCYISSRAFAEYRDCASGFSYYMLPASTFEKFIIPALFSGVLYFLIYTFLFSLIATISSAFWGIIYHYPIQFFNPLSDNLRAVTGSLFITFLVIQPFFLFGAIALRKNHFIVTGIVIFISLLVLFFFGLFYSKQLIGTPQFYLFELIPELALKSSGYILAIVFHVFVLSASLFKLKERQL